MLRADREAKRGPRFSGSAAPIERPVPLWVLYPLFFVAVYATHWPLLRLPYFWDEAGYYIPAAIDFFRTGSLIPHSTLTNAHPPLPSVVLAGWWHAAGPSISGTRTLMTMIAAAALLGVFRLGRMLAGSAVALAVAVLTGLYPVWFAQSTMAHADLFAVAFTVWGIGVYCQRFVRADGTEAGPTDVPDMGHEWGTALLMAGLFSLAALSKETAIVTPVALALWELVLLVTEKPRRVGSWRLIAALLLPIVPLAAWYAYHLHATGFLFGNPEFLRYNATANLTPARVLTSLWHRLVHLLFHMNLWVPALVTLAVLRGPRVTARPLVLTQPVLKALLVVIAGNTLALSVLGGALLTRYLLPVYPLELLVAVALWRERFRAWPALVGLTAAAFFAALFLNPPYSIAPEDNLTYRDMIVLHQQAAEVIVTRFPQATVLTAWPATSELEHPELGYVRRPVRVVAIDNFTADQITKAEQDPSSYDTALVFSTKWIPPAGVLNLGRRTQASDARFYDFHEDLQPEKIAGELKGDVVWRREQNGEWAAVIRFPRSFDAKVVAGGRERVAEELRVVSFE